MLKPHVSRMMLAFVAALSVTQLSGLCFQPDRDVDFNINCSAMAYVDVRVRESEH